MLFHSVPERRSVSFFRDHRYLVNCYESLLVVIKTFKKVTGYPFFNVNVYSEKITLLDL